MMDVPSLQLWVVLMKEDEAFLDVENVSHLCICNSEKVRAEADSIIDDFSLRIRR